MAGRYGKDGVVGLESFVGCSYTGLRRKKKTGQFVHGQAVHEQIVHGQIVHGQTVHIGLERSRKSKKVAAVSAKRTERAGRKRISAAVFTGAMPDSRYALLDTLGDEMAWISKIQIH